MHACADMKMNVGCAGVHSGAARHILIPIVEVYPLAIHQEFQFFPRYFSKCAIVVHEALVDGE